nr:GDP-mannose 4,6-dehydratase [Syntrophomonas palmitatica]
MNVVVTNCSNNYGPKQHKEKLIPTIIRKALAGENIPIYGDGKNVRDWLYVMDHCKGIDLVYHKGTAGENYNIGGNNERTNIDIAQNICDILDSIVNNRLHQLMIASFRDLITFVPDRPGHDRRYAIDASKIKTELAWQPEESFQNGLQKTIDWYLNYARK